MDLGTMSKKLKSSQYQSKKEFTDDLFLIYKNCLTYNTRPVSAHISEGFKQRSLKETNTFFIQDSIYREHAFKMEEKTRVLLQSVPNIHIRTRAEIEKGMSIYDDEKDGK